jgi:hypothetical protein
MVGLISLLNVPSSSASFEAVVSDTVLTPKPFAILENTGDITLCTEIPQRFGGPDPCERFSFNGSSSPARVAIITPRFTASLELNNGGIPPDEIELQGLEEEQPNEEIDVSPECLSTSVLSFANDPTMFFFLVAFVMLIGTWQRILQPNELSYTEQ